MALHIFKIDIQAKLSLNIEGKELLYIFQFTSEKRKVFGKLYVNVNKPLLT